MGVLRKIIDSQIYLSQALDSLLPERYRIDGNRDFLEYFVPRYVKAGIRIYDVGGGKRPYVQLPQKEELRLTVFGLDIDSKELERAPAGAYDETISADILCYRGNADADLVICQSLLEHVQDVELAFAGLTSILRPGGTVLLFVPSRNAWYARLNRLLPDRLKNWLLTNIFTQTLGTQGFPAYYDRCTPADFHKLAAQNGLTVVEEQHYYMSAYFTVFFPLHLIWRIWALTFSRLIEGAMLETFSMALIKRPDHLPIGRDEIKSRRV